MADPRYVLSPEEMARQEAEAYLASQGVAGYSAPVAASVPVPTGGVSQAPPPPPAPPPPAGPSTWENIKKGVGIAYGVESPPPPAKKEAYGPPVPTPEQAAASAPHGQQGSEDRPIVLGQPGMGMGVIPGGMYPHSQTMQVHRGRPAPDEAQAAMAASSASELRGAEAQRDADRQYYNQVRDLQGLKMKATEDAARQHALVQSERDRTAKEQIAKIDALNAEAAAKVDPEKHWKDRGALGRIIGAFAIGLGEFASKMRGGPNVALQIIDAQINREIQAQIANRDSAWRRAGAQQRVMDLHLANLGDKDKAIEATRMGLYDNVLTQLEAYKAQHAANMSDAHYQTLVGGILEKRGEVANKLYLQGADDINEQATQQFHMPQVVGGGMGAGVKGLDNVITIPPSDKTGERPIHVAVNEKDYQELSRLQQFVDHNRFLNDEAMKTRDLYSKAVQSRDLKSAVTYRDRLHELNQERAVLAAQVKDPKTGVRESEVTRELGTGIDYAAGVFGQSTAISGDVTKKIQSNSNRMQAAMNERLRGVTGRVVTKAVKPNQRIPGVAESMWLDTGSTYEPKPVGPEKY